MSCGIPRMALQAAMRGTSGDRWIRRDAAIPIRPPSGAKPTAGGQFGQRGPGPLHGVHVTGVGLREIASDIEIDPKQGEKAGNGADGFAARERRADGDGPVRLGLERSGWHRGKGAQHVRAAARGSPLHKFHAAILGSSLRAPVRGDGGQRAVAVGLEPVRRHAIGCS